jgi:2-C-methyl-D-erythritol 4-phosphate cytidylyltransferase
LIHPFVVIIPSAGISSRYGGGVPKQYEKINGKLVLEYSLEKFLSFKQCIKIIIMTSRNDSYAKDLLKDDRIEIITGGPTRAESVKLGFDYLISIGLSESVLIHDAARPCLLIDEIEKFLLNFFSSNNCGSIFAVPCSDTIKSSLDSKKVDKTIDRSKLWFAQTPQIFRFPELQEAYRLYKGNLNKLTDESSLFDDLDGHINLFKSSIKNIKLTYKSDLELAELIINLKSK